MLLLACCNEESKSPRSRGGPNGSTYRVRSVSGIGKISTLQSPWSAAVPGENVAVYLDSESLGECDVSRAGEIWVSECGGDINGTAGSEDVKLVRSVRKRKAEEVDIDEKFDARMMHAQPNQGSRSANFIIFKHSPRRVLTDTWDRHRMRDKAEYFPTIGRFPLAIRDNRISIIGHSSFIMPVPIAKGKSMCV